MGRINKQNKQQKILWVEDDYYHVKGLVKPLEKIGFQVVPARSFVEAKSLLKNWSSFCIVLLDLIIPYSERELVNPNQKEDETNETVSENGLALFDYMVEELRINVPIVILSVIRTQQIMDSLMSKGAARTVEKSGLLPKDIKHVVLDVIGGGKTKLG